MHRPFEDGLEDHLSGRAASENLKQFEQHLAGCAECRAQAEAMRAHQQLLNELRSPEMVDPAPGFYARVMERIETQKTGSFWSIFLESAFGMRLMYASLALFFVLGSAVWQMGGSPAIDEANPVSIMAGSDLPAATGDDPGRDRTVVLTNLVSLSSGRPLDSLPVSSD